MVSGAVFCRDKSCIMKFVEIRLAMCDGKGVQSATLFAGQRYGRAGIQAAAQQGSDRNIGRQTSFDCNFQQSQDFLVQLFGSWHFAGRFRNRTSTSTCAPRRTSKAAIRRAEACELISGPFGFLTHKGR